MAPTAGMPLVSHREPEQGVCSPTCTHVCMCSPHCTGVQHRARGDPTGWQANTLGLLMPHQSCSPDR